MGAAPGALRRLQPTCDDLDLAYPLYQGLPYALVAGAVFLLYSCFYARFRRIAPLIVAHAGWNLLVTATHL